VHLNAPTVDLQTHVADVVNLLRWEELTDVVLCGHSYGGCVVKSVVAQVPERIRKLVYLDAFVPDPGKSLHDMLPPEQRELPPGVGDGWKVPPIPAEVFNVNAADRAWVDAQCTPQSIATFRQGVGAGELPGDPRHTSYLLATGWGASPFAQFHERAQAKGWACATIDCGHDVMLDRPAELVGFLEKCADS
jgi:pimeloyl-ACP methyl ester carboxylesterase